MMAHESVPPPAQRKGSFQLAAHGQHRLLGRRTASDRPRRVTARTPQRQLGAVHHPRHRIVAADMDRPIVEQKQIGNAGQAFHGIGVIDGNRFIGTVAAGHHQRHAVDRLHQQMMELACTAA